MARKPSRLIEYKIRIRDELRRRLEQAAKKRDVSVNQEMAARLAESFERSEVLKLDQIVDGLENVYQRFAREERDRLQTQELINAAEALIRGLPSDIKDRDAVKRAVAWVQEAIAAIARIHGRTYDEHETEDQK